MSMVTLKKYLYDREPEVRRVLSVVFSGLVNSAVRTDDDEFAALKTDIERIEGSLDEDFTLEHALVAVGGAMQALEGYNQHTARFIRQQGMEMQKIAAMLADSILRISGSSDRAYQVLGEIKSNLERAGGLEDLQKVKASLAVCLEQVCEESLRQKEEAQATIAELHRHIECAEGNIAFRPDTDRVTGLPSRPAAEAALRTALETPGRKYLGIVVLDRLQSINARFGNAIGDEVLAELARHIEANLTEGDTAFRWSGPTLLVLMPRQCSIDRMRIEVKPTFGKCLEKEFNNGGRTVMIPISATWAVFGMVPPLSTILKHIDAFVASQTPKEYQ